jgi:hypothetical protein
MWGPNEEAIFYLQRYIFNAPAHNVEVFAAARQSRR